MEADYKILGQSNPAATTLTSLYSVPVATQAIVSTITVCNIDGGNATYRIALRPAGAAIDDRHYIVYNAALANGQTQALTLGITLDATDVISVYASHDLLTFQAFGSELT